MSKQSEIRFRENDLKELRRVVKNYNAKLSRQRSKLIENDERYQASQLPPKASVRELRDAIGTRKEFNAELNRMRNYISTGERYAIDKNTKKSLYATTRDFNRKLDRLHAKAKTQGDRAALPERLDPEELIRMSSNKEELKRFIKDFKGFLHRGSEELVELPNSKHNIKLTKWQKQMMESRLEIANVGRDRELAAWRATEVKYGGKGAGYTQGEARVGMGAPSELKHLPLYNFSSTYSDMREKMRLIMRESQAGYWDARTELARINYTEKMDKLIGNHPIGKMLLKRIKSLPLDDFKRTLLSDDDLFLLLYRIEDHQKHNDHSSEAYEEVLNSIWNEWYPDKDMYDELENYIRRKVGE